VRYVPTRFIVVAHEDTDVIGELLAVLPDWLVLGVALGMVFSVAIAATFIVGERLYPTAPIDPSQVWSGDERRRAEIREFLRTINEPFAENHFVEGQNVAFYLPMRDVAITFDARAYYRIERSPTYAVLVEHEMPGFHLAGRLPFETPEIELTNGTPDATSMAFAVLGLPKTATSNELKQAYRKRIKEVHPDHGGDYETFTRVREAYTTAKKRAN
jgi:hypothetical protein